MVRENPRHQAGEEEVGLLGVELRPEAEQVLDQPVLQGEVGEGEVPGWTGEMGESVKLADCPLSFKVTGVDGGDEPPLVYVCLYSGHQG